MERQRKKRKNFKAKTLRLLRASNYVEEWVRIKGTFAKKKKHVLVYN